MGKVFPSLDPSLVAWMRQQPLFFVGTAPLAADGHVNVSPKGPIGTLAVLDDRTVAYLDMSAAAPRPSLICARTGASS